MSRKCLLDHHYLVLLFFFFVYIKLTCSTWLICSRRPIGQLLDVSFRKYNPPLCQRSEITGSTLPVPIRELKYEIVHHHLLQDNCLLFDVWLYSLFRWYNQYIWFSDDGFDGCGSYIVINIDKWMNYAINMRKNDNSERLFMIHCSHKLI